MYVQQILVATMVILAATTGTTGLAEPLPTGVTAEWSLDTAYRERTPTRERICINGLWRWQPAVGDPGRPPMANWGFFKVPGCWPGITDYLQKDCQTVYADPRWRNQSFGALTAAWYEREISIPAGWGGRRIALTTETLNSFAAVYVDGEMAGEMQFPGGKVDLTPVCRPGRTYRLSLRVIALPMSEVLVTYHDTARAREERGAVARRGLCGDVYLLGEPAVEQVTTVAVETSVQRWQVTIRTGLSGLAASAQYRLRAEVLDHERPVETFTSSSFGEVDLTDGRFTFTSTWKPEKLWDIDTPQNTYELRLSLRGAGDRLLDQAFPQRFGFREFRIKGRDFYLNGSRIFLSAVPLDNAQVGAAWATYDGARESLRRLKRLGINFLYTHNYDCQPGAHLSFEDILRAADDVGMLVALTQPHFSQYDWSQPNADESNGYRLHAAYYARVAGSHPSVVTYAMSHNATGYNEDMNPDLIDGIHAVRDHWALENAKLAMRAVAIVERLDPSRIVYHHASGNLGAIHSINFYPNFSPIQELSDWFAHWATVGVKPVFLCEYGAPFTWDWTMYRGWYQGKREFGSARAPWEFCLAEWDAQFLGDGAYHITEMEKKNLRWESTQFRAGHVWNRWDYPYPVGSPLFDDQQTVMARYLSDNWRAYRTWGVSGISPWEYEMFWRARPGVDRSRKELKTDWTNLQRPGFSPDYVADRYERIDMAFQPEDWMPGAAATALLRNNGPALAYIGGKQARFTSKDHVFYPGETMEKQLIVINNSRRTLSCDCEWTLHLPHPLAGRASLTVPTGEIERVPLRFALPRTLPAGEHVLAATFRFGSGEVQSDSFAVRIVSRPRLVELHARFALFDPGGETSALLKRMHIPVTPLNADTNLSPFDLLLIGKAALSPSAPAPDLTKVRQGLRVVIFEQTAAALEQRLGFRVEEYGLRQVFPRVPDHPALAGLDSDLLRDWRGEATTVPPRRQYTLNPRFNGAPTVEWAGFDVTRVWRCGCQGNVASVLIEKPSRGDFLPIVDGGFSLQYSPLLEHREGSGMVLFCQLDVTGRTEPDPAAETLVSNLLKYAAQWKPTPRRTTVYSGDEAGRDYLMAAGLCRSVDPRPTADSVLILGPGGERESGERALALRSWIANGGHLVCVGLGGADFLSVPVRMKSGEHIATVFDPQGMKSPFRGVGTADVHNRDPRDLPLVTSGATGLGDGVLASALNGRVVFDQLAPWHFEPRGQLGLRRTYRRTAAALTRILANVGIREDTPLLERFGRPVAGSKAAPRWLEGLYVDRPQEWDDPYRFFRW